MRLGGGGRERAVQGRPCLGDVRLGKTGYAEAPLKHNRGGRLLMVGDRNRDRMGREGRSGGEGGELASHTPPHSCTHHRPGL